MKRSRGRNRRPGGNQQNAFNNPNRHFESVGPDVKIRGSAQQVLEKYQQYARDAHTSGDRILSEAYFQYAEHYQRIVAKQNEARMQQGGHSHGQSQNPGQNQGQTQGQNQGLSRQASGHAHGSREDRDSRGQPDRYPRGPGDEALQADDEIGEAEVISAGTARDNEEQDNNESLRVIDADDDRDVVDASDATQSENRGERASGDRYRRGRKPYRPREEGTPRDARPPREPVESVAISETDGVMKTLSRGRRKLASEEAAAAEHDD